jgi:vacuolar-type H+-ATPase subunit D/Vma8
VESLEACASASQLQQVALEGEREVLLREMQSLRAQYNELIDTQRAEMEEAFARKAAALKAENVELRYVHV